MEFCYLIENQFSLKSSFVQPHEQASIECQGFGFSEISRLAYPLGGSSFPVERAKTQGFQLRHGFWACQIFRLAYPSAMSQRNSRSHVRAHMIVSLPSLTPCRVYPVMQALRRLQEGFGLQAMLTAVVTPSEHEIAQMWACEAVRLQFGEDLGLIHIVEKAMKEIPPMRI